MSSLLFLRPGRSAPSAPQNQRQNRFAGRRQDSREELELDYSNCQTLTEILLNITPRDGISKGKRLAYLNAFVKFLNVSGNKRELWPYTLEDALLCLRVSLIHEATVVRLAALRVLRYLLQTEEDMIIMTQTGVPYLIVRSLDFLLNNSAERLQATRLCQRMLAIPRGAAHFPTPITRSLIAISFDGAADGDKLYRASISILCQLALLNPMQFIECGGVRVLLHNILGCTSPMVLEAMVGSLLHLLNVPETRDASGVNLQALVAPFTDVHYKHGANEPSDKDLDEREVGYRCAKTAIGAVLKSWSGIAHFCQSRNSGLQALVDALYIEQLEIRRTILDLICEILGVKFPTWSDEVSVALSAVDPSTPQDSWKMEEGFVVQEALAVLPHLAVSTPNITANHMALIVLSFLQRGLLEALVQVIVTGDTFISVRGTVLLGELLHLVDRLIPLQCYDPTHCIPTLIRHSADLSSPQQQQQRALEALSVLTSLQKVKARPPRPSSLFLQAQLEYASYQPIAQGRFINKLGHVHVSRLLKRDIEGNPGKLLKDTGVLNSKDSSTWQWDTIVSLIKWAPEVLKKVEDSQWHNLLKRLVDYLKPSSNLFARQELGKGQAKLISKTANALVTFLAEQVQNFNGSVLLEILLADIANRLDEILQQPQNPAGCFLSPSKLESTCSQYYFLLIGRLTNSSKGYSIVEKGQVLKRFLDIVCQVENQTYVKLIISSLCYKEDYPKRILSAALCCPFESTRLFATQFLRILVRAKLQGFSKWGMELLVNQLSDKNRSISLTAMDILEEAVHDKMFLESLIGLRPSLSHLGDRGLLLLVTFLSQPSGFKFLMDAKWLRDELQKWKMSFNKRYVEVVEVLVRDTVSTLRRGEDGKYPERASRNTQQSKFVDIYVPPHLYGQLVQHKEGLELLLEHGDIQNLMVTVNSKRCGNPEETKELKGALWAVSHFATSADTVPILEEARVLERMVELGRFCPILSLRHTVFHCLCLICVTVAGCEALRKYGWHAMPRSHQETFTIWSPEMFIAEETRRLMKLRVERELPEDLLEENQLDPTEEEEERAPEEDEEEAEEELLMMTEEVKASSLTTPSGLALSGGPWSHAHHRSASESHALSSQQGSSTAMRRPSAGRRVNINESSSWRWRKDSVTESTTSGVSSCESNSVLATRGVETTTAAIHTLSPIPSSASIATNSDPHSPPSRGSSRATLTEPLISHRWSGSPLHRSLRMRKPLIGVSLGTDSGHGANSSTLAMLKTGSLDRHILSPGDLFAAHKMMGRVNSSLTSLSTPSFRIRPESEIKGPCYMGLCVPDDFGAIFLTDSSIPLHVRMTSDIDSENKELQLGDSFEFHTTANCLGCYKLRDEHSDTEEEPEVSTALSAATGALSLSSVVGSLGEEWKDDKEKYDGPSLLRKEVLRLVSNLICCVGAKANEQGLLRLKQKFPAAFQDLCLYTELCAVMSKYNLRLALRRFLQELFYDNTFSQLYDVAALILRTEAEEEVREIQEPLSLPETPITLPEGDKQ